MGEQYRTHGVFIYSGSPIIGGRGAASRAAKTTMFTQTSQLNRLRRGRFQHGQSIVVALLVLLLLGLAGALFVTIIARNLINAGHANRVQTADTYAAAGITYADAQLANSIDGADWRPPLQYQLAVPPTEARELARYNAAKSTLTDGTVLPYSSDPDLPYLQAGYARYNTGAGRFLVRVTYDPVNVALATVPPGKYLKIESIGREGTINQTDPTTYSNNRSSDRTQAYQVAYVPIGITDYARFETNPDKRSDIANLGVASEFYAANTDGGIATPGVSDFNSTGTTGGTGSAGTAPTIQEYPVITTYGAVDAYLQSSTTPPVLYPNPAAGSGNAAPSSYTALPGGGSIHANMTTRFFGTNVIYLNTGAAGSPLFQDTAEIGGDLLLDSYSDTSPLYTTSSTATAGQQAALILNPKSLSNPTTGSTILPVSATNPNNSTMNAYVAPSNSTVQENGTFDTHGGLIRDGSMQNDPEGLPRSITRLEPPQTDALDNASQMPRYRAIAMNSAPRPNLMLNGSAYTPAAGVNPSLYGYGKAIYVNNTNDIQQSSATIGGGSTLTDEWLHRTSALASGTNKGGWNGLFYNPPGVNIVLGQFIPSTSGSGSSAGSYGIRLTRTAGDQFANPDGSANGGAEMDVRYSDLDTDPTGAASDNDIIIYAEGNVRLRGILSPNEGTGNTATTQKFIPRHITIVTGGTAYIEGNLLKGSPDSTISVLAHDNVCINTTQFLAGANVEDRTDGSQNPELPDSGDTLSLDDGHSLLQEFNFGLTGGATPAAKYGMNNLALYIAAGPAGGGSTTADLNIFGVNGNSVFPALQIQPLSTLTHTTFDLSALVTQPTSSNPLFNALGTDLFRLSISKDPGTENGVNTSQDVALERAAVLPMDIRIEAVMYAQTGSFFVIPGEWFNTNSDDTLTKFLLSGTRPDVEVNGGQAASGGSQPAAFLIPPVNLDRFPMYGQPIDLKITIYGSVSEAHPADIAAQTAWMQHWGWIPQYHGSLVLSSGSAGTGGASMTPETAGHVQSGQQPAIGLQIIYDPQAGYPYSLSTTAGMASYYLRSDIYGRPLPWTPKLPVSTGLLYSGQSGEPPLLQ